LIQTQAYTIINPFENNTYTLPVHNFKFYKTSQLLFHIGVDSTHTDVDTFSGDLHPKNGMYWTWQSSHINFKLGGTIKMPDNTSKEFLLHLGGYQEPNHNAQIKILPIGTQKAINIYCPLDAILGNQIESNIPNLMTPCKLADSLMTLFVNEIKIVQ
jgi:hypothetical protein